MCDCTEAEEVRLQDRLSRHAAKWGEDNQPPGSNMERGRLRLVGSQKTATLRREGGLRLGGGWTGKSAVETQSFTHSPHLLNPVDAANVFCITVILNPPPPPLSVNSDHRVGIASFHDDTLPLLKHDDIVKARFGDLLILAALKREREMYYRRGRTQ